MGNVLGIAALSLICLMTAAFLVYLSRRATGPADVPYGLRFIDKAWSDGFPCRSRIAMFPQTPAPKRES